MNDTESAHPTAAPTPGATPPLQAAERVAHPDCAAPPTPASRPALTTGGQMACAAAPSDGDGVPVFPEATLEAAHAGLEDPAGALTGEHEPRVRRPNVSRPSSAQGPGRAAQDELLAGLGRRFRGTTLRREFELRATLTRQVFRRDFVYVSQQLHALEASRRVQGIDRRVLNDALIAVERHAEFLKTALRQASAESTALIAANGQADAPVEFAPPVRLQATIVSPYASAFVDLLRAADDTLTQHDRAWLLGLLDPTAKAQRATDCRKLLQGFKEVVRQQRHVVGEHVRQVNALRRARRDEASKLADTSRAAAARRPRTEVSEDVGASSHLPPPGAAARRPAWERHEPTGRHAPVGGMEADGESS